MRPHTSLLATVAVVSLFSGAGGLRAQDVNSSPELEALIPDAAILNSEQWAKASEEKSEIVPPAQEVPHPSEQLDAADEGELSTEPLAQKIMEAAEQGVEIGTVSGLGTEIGIQSVLEQEIQQEDFLAGLKPEGENITQTSELSENAEVPFSPTLSGGVALSTDLMLFLPEDSEGFPERSQFIERFSEFSSLSKLDEEKLKEAQNSARLAALAREDETLINELLRSYGYYGAQVSRSINPQDTNAGKDDKHLPLVRFDIVPGPQYRIGEIDLGPNPASENGLKIRDILGLESGDPLVRDTILAKRAALITKLGEAGYPFAKVGEPSLTIDHRNTTGNLDLSVSSTGQYVFSGVDSALPEFLSGKHLASIARIKKGALYRETMREDLRRAIIATGLVSSLTLNPREIVPPQNGKPGEVILDANFTKAPVRTIAGAVGYGSQEGVRVQASWEHRNMFPPEGALKFRAIAGTKEQVLGASFTRNNLGGRDKALVVDAYASSLNTIAYDARALAFTGTYERRSNYLFQRPFTWSFGAEILATDERSRTDVGAIAPRKTYFIAALTSGAFVDTSDSLLDPSKGYRVSLRVSPAASRQASQESFYTKVQIDSSAYISAAPKVVLAGRIRAATITGAQLTEIAPSRRLYAGGGTSLRGYGYQAVSPLNEKNEAIGGRALWDASLEARIKTGLMGGAVSFAPFFDLGAVSAGKMPGKGEVKMGAGLGLRYMTDFGPMRIDVGVPFQRGPADGPVGVYISLGQAF